MAGSQHHRPILPSACQFVFAQDRLWLRGRSVPATGPGDRPEATFWYDSSAGLCQQALHGLATKGVTNVFLSRPSHASTSFPDPSMVLGGVLGPQAPHPPNIRPCHPPSRDRSQARVWILSQQGSCQSASHLASP